MKKPYLISLCCSPVFAGLFMVTVWNVLDDQQVLASPRSHVINVNIGVRTAISGLTSSRGDLGGTSNQERDENIFNKANLTVTNRPYRTIIWRHGAISNPN